MTAEVIMFVPLAILCTGIAVAIARSAGSGSIMPPMYSTRVEQPLWKITTNTRTPVAETDTNKNTESQESPELKQQGLSNERD